MSVFESVSELLLQPGSGMCWNQEVSVAFSVAEAVLLLSIAQTASSRESGVAKHFLPIGVTVLCHEILEAVVWPYVPQDDSGVCPRTNHYGSLLLQTSLGLQPMLIA